MSSDKTEQPTAKRKREARRDGNLARSPEVVAWVQMLAAGVLLPASFSLGTHALRQVMKMDELATQTGEANYHGLTKFFRAVLFSQLTEIYGDIPYTHALEALSGNTKPVYDKQEDVYAGILNELEEANSILADSKGNIGGDIIYGGKASQWKKLVNA